MFIPIVSPLLRLALAIVSVVIYALTAVAAFGGRIDPEISSFPSALTLILPYLAWTTFFITVIWLCTRKYIPGILGVLTLIVCWGPITTASPLHGSRKPDPGAVTFSVMTYNMIHGWDLEDKGGERNRTIQYILDSGADIVCLQELREVDGKEIPLFTKAQEDSLWKVYPYVLGDPKIDTKVLSKYPGRMINSGDRISDPNDQARYSFYKINIQGHVLTLVNLHLLSFMLTPKEREVFTGIRSLEDFKTSYREIKGDIADKLKKGFVRRKKDTQILRNAIEDIEGPLILCGDFNDVPESYAYRTLKGDDLRDAYVETNFGPLITYNRHKMLFHIDQILYRGPLQALSVDKGRIRTSDHYPLMARFAFTDSE